METQVSQNVIATDRRLDKATERGTEELAAHRWHWTLDETNAKRVSLRAYASAVGKQYKTITVYANGYAAWLADREGGTSFTVSDCISRAQVGADKAAAIDAVAKASGSTFEHTRRSKAPTVDTVRAIAEQRAERNRSTVAEELHGAAESVVKGHRGDAKRREERKGRHAARFFEVEGDIASAMRKLRHALQTAQGVNFTDEERDLIAHAIDTLRSALELIDLAVIGSTKVDWDKELAKLDGAS